MAADNDERPCAVTMPGSLPGGGRRLVAATAIIGLALTIATSALALMGLPFLALRPHRAGVLRACAVLHPATVPGNIRGIAMKPTLILVGADKGGVGKTTVSRILLDYFARKNVLTRAFDTENPRGSLKRFYPGSTEIIDVENVAHQMKVLDTLETANVPVTLVDLKAGGLSYALDIFERIGVLEAARAGQFTLGLFHIVGSSIASLDEIGEIAKYLNGIDYIVTRNFINETNFFEWDEATTQKYFSAIPKALEVDIPKLNEMAYEQVDLSGVTFKDFIDTRTADGQAGKFSFVLRGYVRKWCAEIDEEFAKVKLLQDIVSGGRAPAIPEKRSSK